MSDERQATEEQLDRIERGVQRRLDRRAAIAADLRRGLVAVVILGTVVGGVAAISRAMPTTGASGSSAAEGSAPAAGVEVLCHASSAAGSRTTAATVRSLDARSVTLACAVPDAEARPSANATASSATTSGGSAAVLDVICRDGRGRINAFPSDAHPATLCARNGMRVP